MNPNHLIAVVLAVLLFRAFVRDLRAASQPAPIRVRADQRPTRD